MSKNVLTWSTGPADAVWNRCQLFRWLLLRWYLCGQPARHCATVHVIPVSLLVWPLHINTLLLDWLRRLPGRAFRLFTAIYSWWDARLGLRSAVRNSRMTAPMGAHQVIQGYCGWWSLFVFSSFYGFFECSSLQSRFPISLAFIYRLGFLQVWWDAALSLYLCTDKQADGGYFFLLLWRNRIQDDQTFLICKLYSSCIQLRILAREDGVKWCWSNSSVSQWPQHKRRWGTRKIKNHNYATNCALSLLLLFTESWGHLCESKRCLMITLTCLNEIVSFYSRFLILFYLLLASDLCILTHTAITFKRPLCRRCAFTTFLLRLRLWDTVHYFWEFLHDLSWCWESKMLKLLFSEYLLTMTLSGDIYAVNTGERVCWWNFICVIWKKLIVIHLQSCPRFSVCSYSWLGSLCLAHLSPKRTLSFLRYLEKVSILQAILSATLPSWSTISESCRDLSL